MSHKLVVTIPAIAVLLALSACGGGGGGGGDSTTPSGTPASSAGTWDQMNWNEKNWQ